jgi:Holliday junction DNA helicase RuvB
MKLVTIQRKELFEEIIGYNHIKRLFRMALESDSPVHILLMGPPASAKTMFLTSLMHQLKNSYFTDGVNSTKAGMADYLVTNKPRYLLIDEFDKMSSKDQIILLNLMETGMVSETKYGKTRSTQIKTSVFATSNITKNFSAPILSRFFIVELETYTYEQFCGITDELLLGQNVEREVASIIANAVWNKSRDIRDCVRIGTLAKSLEDVRFLVETFL